MLKQYSSLYKTKIKTAEDINFLNFVHWFYGTRKRSLLEQNIKLCLNEIIKSLFMGFDLIKLLQSYQSWGFNVFAKIVIFKYLIKMLRL